MVLLTMRNPKIWLLPPMAALFLPIVWAATGGISVSILDSMMFGCVNVMLKGI